MSLEHLLLSRHPSQTGPTKPESSNQEEPRPGRTTTSQTCEAVPKRLVFKAHRLAYHSTLGWRGIKKGKKDLLHFPTTQNVKGAAIKTRLEWRRHTLQRLIDSNEAEPSFISTRLVRFQVSPVLIGQSEDLAECAAI